MRKILLLSTIFVFVLGFGFVHGEGKKKTFPLPDYVLDISKDNTYPNPTQDLPQLVPSELTEQLLKSASVKIENPELIRLLNESSITNAKSAPLLRASIYLGEWPLSYESKETTVNWEYQKVNTNFLDNRGGKEAKRLYYVQEQQKKVTGGLTAQLPRGEDVKKMMLMKAMERTGLPLAFETVIGYGTKKDQVYNVSPKNVGYLYSFVPAANEKGKVTFGEVYLIIKGGKPKLEIKNVTQQGIGAWIPVQDHLSFQFHTGKHPR